MRPGQPGRPPGSQGLRPAQPPRARHGPAAGAVAGHVRVGSRTVPVIPVPLRPDDDGSADAAVVSALSAFQSGTAAAAEVLAVLSEARLLVPVVALLTESELGEHGLKQDKESEMALPKLIGKDGREAVIAFTGVESMKLWR